MCNFASDMRKRSEVVPRLLPACDLRRPSDVAQVSKPAVSQASSLHRLPTSTLVWNFTVMQRFAHKLNGRQVATR